MGLNFADIDDAVLLTQQNFIKRGAFVDMQTDLQKHVAVREMWKRRTKQFSGGDPWEWELQIDHNYSAKAVGMYETDASSAYDTMIKGTVYCRHINANYIYDLKEPAFQKGPAKIVDYIKTKMTAMYCSVFEYMEPVLWTKPTDSTDEKTPYGVGYWVLKCTGSEGWESTNPSGFSAGRGNIDSTTYTRHANWAAIYAQVAPEDLIRKMRKGARQTYFESVLSHAQPTLGGGPRNGIYTNDSVIGLMEELLEQRNMNLQNDLAVKDGRTTFKSSPVIFVPYLDNDSSNPVYMLDWNWLVIGVLAGWENNLTKPYMVPNKHGVRRVDLDCSLNMVCTDCRRQAVFSTS